MRIGVDLDYTLIYRGDEKSVQEIPGATEFLSKYSKMGVEFVLITARNCSELKVVTAICEWFEKRADFKFVALVFTDGKPKGKYAKQHGCEILIDDCKKYLEDCDEYGVTPVHFTGEW